MEFQKCEKPAFAVIGKEGTTADGEGFIKRLWDDANSHFSEIAHLAKKDGAGNIVGIWGAMSDVSRSFKPWENGFSKGLYLAGVECVESALPPPGWTKWTVPGYEYLCAEKQGGVSFAQVIEYLRENNIPLVGAAHDFTNPATGKGCTFFPVRKL